MRFGINIRVGGNENLNIFSPKNEQIAMPARILSINDDYVPKANEPLRYLPKIPIYIPI